jgi:hypothetical protein
VEPADRVAPSRGDKSRTDTQDAQGLCVAAHDSVPLHALKANNVGSVEKPADEEPSGRRFLEWVVRHAGWARSESIQPVAKTGVFLDLESIERTTFHVERRRVEAIRRQADLDHLTITQVVNEAFRRSFEST